MTNKKKDRSQKGEPNFIKLIPTKIFENSQLISFCFISHSVGLALYGYIEEYSKWYWQLPFTIGLGILIGDFIYKKVESTEAGN